MSNFFYFGVDLEKQIYNTNSQINCLIDNTSITRINHLSLNIPNILGYQIKDEDLTMLILLRFSEWLQQSELNIERISNGHVNDQTFILFLTTYKSQLANLIQYCHNDILSQWEILQVKLMGEDYIYMINTFNKNIITVNNHFLKK